MSVEKAMFAAGCFWGVELNFRKLPGVLDVEVGYSGGHVEKPTYEQVCTDATGHAEVVLVTYDPAKISYEALLEALWEMHDPTTLNRQGPDEGTQYRSGIYTFTPEQKVSAEASKAQAQKRFAEPITTEILPAATFWKAEEYHQRYLEKKGITIACH